MSDVDVDLFDEEEFRIQIESVERRAQLIELFPEETGVYLERVQSALENNDAAELHLAAHGLKGAVGNYLGTRAFSAATELDRLARARDLSAARDAFHDCEAEVRALGEALAKFQAEDE
jgi:HPt (histidine-containing phosphotransfer) domain-containing protein